MKPVEEPRNNIYIKPRDFQAEWMHYSIIRVSEYRYVVAEYSGAFGQTGEHFPKFTVVSKPMKFSDASDLALELRNDRINK